VSRPARAPKKVLDAAGRLLASAGTTGFTLDAVATEAAVSKGGLMYHYPTKEALLEALVDRAVTAVDDALAHAAASTEPGAFTRAYLDLTIPALSQAAQPQTAQPQTAQPQTAQPQTAQPQTTPDEDTPIAALVAVVALDPRLLTPLREAYARWQHRLERDGLDQAAATAVRLAVDGWWLAGLLDLPPLSADVYQSTRALLANLCIPGPGDRSR
jgi:AcrR family transcriptional regulator